MGNNWQAINDFEQAIKLDDRYSPAYYYLGISKLKDHKPEEAKEDFDKALALDFESENPGIYDGLA